MTSLKGLLKWRPGKHPAKKTVSGDTGTPQRRPLAYDRMLQEAGKRGPRFLVLSGCQSQMLSGFFETLTLGVSSYHFIKLSQLADFKKSEWQRYQSDLDEADLIYTQKAKVAEALRDMPQYRDKVYFIPVISCAVFHPDISYMRYKEERFVGPMGDYHSILASAAYFAGMRTSEAMECFHPELYKRAGFIEKSRKERTAFIKRFSDHDIDLAQCVKQWEGKGTWMRTLNHPTRQVIHDIVLQVLQRDGISIENPSPSTLDWVDDDLARSAEWPVYPGISNDAVGNPSLARERMIFRSPYKHAGKPILMRLNQLINYTYESLKGSHLEYVKMNNYDLRKVVDTLKAL